MVTIESRKPGDLVHGDPTGPSHGGSSTGPLTEKVAFSEASKVVARGCKISMIVILAHPGEVGVSLVGAFGGAFVFDENTVVGKVAVPMFLNLRRILGLVSVMRFVIVVMVAVMMMMVVFLPGLMRPVLDVVRFGLLVTAVCELRRFDKTYLILLVKGGKWN